MEMNQSRLVHPDEPIWIGSKLTWDVDVENRKIRASLFLVSGS
jgi:hypothetical protein